MSQREKLAKAAKKMEDDGIMVKVYDNLQDEIKGKINAINQIKGKLKSRNPTLTICRLNLNVIVKIT